MSAFSFVPSTDVLNTSADKADKHASFGDDALFNQNLQALIAQQSQDVDLQHDSSHLQHRQGLRLGSYHLMIHYHDASEISEMPKISVVPNAPTWFVGFCNLHGLLIPVFDLKHYFGLEDTTLATSLSNRGSLASNRPMLLVLSHHANSTGIIIDGLLQRLQFDESSQCLDADVPISLEPVLTGCYEIEQTIWFDLDVTNLLQALEHSLASKI